MEPLFLLIGVGLVGGLIVAACLMKAKINAPRHAALDASATVAVSTDPINMAHIRVAGVGGLGLVVMAAGVAYAVPGIREAVVLGILLGSAMALILIRRRRVTGPMPSSGRRSGANTALSIDAPEMATPDDDGHRPSNLSPPALLNAASARCRPASASLTSDWNVGLSRSASNCGLRVSVGDAK